MNTNLICHTLMYDNSGSFLIMRRAKDESVLTGYWDIAGGSLDGRESPLECAKRETKEESGVSPGLQDLDIAFHTSNIDEGKGERFVRLIFIYGPVDNSVVLSKEHDKFKWVNPKTAKKEFQLVDYLEDCFKTIAKKSHNLYQLPGNPN